MALQLRRGLAAERLLITPRAGELIFVTDWEEADVPALWIGDGITPGGIIAATQKLDDIVDVEIDGVVDNELLAYNATLDKWVNTADITVNTLTSTGDVTVGGSLEVFAGFDVTGDITTDGDLYLQNDLVGQAGGTIYFGNDATSRQLAYNAVNNRFELTDNLWVGDGVQAGNITLTTNTIATTSGALVLDPSSTEQVQIAAGSDLYLLGSNLTVNGSITGNTLDINGGGDIAGDLYMTGAASSIIFADSDTTTRGIRGQSGTNDYWFFGGGATGADAGFAEIATAETDDEIYVRQYNGTLFGGIAKQITLLDSAGNSEFPGSITSGALQATGNSQITGDLLVTQYLNGENVQAGFVTSTLAGLRVQTTAGYAQLQLDAATGKLAFVSSNSGTRLEFNSTDQWFNTGKLGINNSAPAYNIDVTGNGRISDSLQVNNDLTVGRDLIVTRDLYVNGTTTTIDTTNLVIEDNLILLNKNETGAGVTAGVAGIDIERGTGANAQWVWNETYDNWAPEGAASKIYADQIVVGNNFSVDTDTISVDNVNHRLGVGTNTPQYTLDVDGSARVQGTLYATGISGVGSLTVTDLTTTNLTVDTDTLYVDSTNNRVGVGTLTPAYELDVDGTVRAQNNLLVTNNLGIGTLTPAYDLDVVGSANISANLTVNNVVTTNLTVDTDTLYVDAVGNRVGIGTLTPDTLLDVDGDAKVRGNLELFGNASVSGYVVVDGTGRFDTVTLTTSTTTADQVVFTAAANTVKCVIEVASGTDYQALEVLMLTDGTTAVMTQYADINTNGNLATFSTDYSSGMRLLVTPVNATTTIKVANITILA